MKPTPRITIPEPCHENWARMTSTEKGKFCQACSKEVIDFTTKANEDIFKHITDNKKICGRFLPHQLDTPLQLERKQKQWTYKQFFASMLFPISLLLSQKSISQAEKPKTIQTSKTYTSLGIGMQHRKLAKDSILVRGTVLDDNGIPLPGVNVVEKDTKNGTSTDFDGNFEISVTNNASLVFSFVGYITQTKAILNSADTIEINMIMDPDIMGEVVIVGMIAVEDYEEESCDWEC